MNKVEQEVSEMKRKLSDVEGSIVTLSSMTLDLICLLNSKLTHIVTLSTTGGREGIIDTDDN